MNFTWFPDRKFLIPCFVASAEMRLALSAAVIPGGINVWTVMGGHVGQPCCLSTRLSCDCTGLVGVPAVNSAARALASKPVTNKASTATNIVYDLVPCC